LTKNLIDLILKICQQINSKSLKKFTPRKARGTYILRRQQYRHLFGALVSLSGLFFLSHPCPCAGSPEQHAARTLALRLDLVQNLVRVRVQCARLCHVTPCIRLLLFNWRASCQWHPLFLITFQIISHFCFSKYLSQNKCTSHFLRS
jgi:hypothetical protein